MVTVKPNPPNQETKALIHWLKHRIKNQAELAEKLGMNGSTLRARLSKGHLPAWLFLRICQLEGIDFVNVNEALAGVRDTRKPS